MCNECLDETIYIYIYIYYEHILSVNSLYSLCVVCFKMIFQNSPKYKTKIVNIRSDNIEICVNKRGNEKKRKLGTSRSARNGARQECVRSRLPDSGNHPTRAQQAKAKPRPPPRKRNRSDLPFPRLLSAAKSTTTSLPVSPIRSDPNPHGFFQVHPRRARSGPALPAAGAGA